jgi:hypothetical protein
MEHTPVINMVAQVWTNFLGMVSRRLNGIRRTKLLGAVIAAGAMSMTPAMAADFFCTPTEVAVWNYPPGPYSYSNRVHVGCATAAQDGKNKIWFWAISTSDAQMANRFLSTATTALVSGRSLHFFYDAGDTSGTSFACRDTDCRVPLTTVIY